MMAGALRVGSIPMSTSPLNDEPTALSQLKGPADLRLEAALRHGGG